MKKIGNYIECVVRFQEGINRSANPLQFLQTEYDFFKNRMRKRLKNSHDEVSIGEFNGISYSYNGKVICHDRRGKPHQLEIDILNLIEFDPSQENSQSQQNLIQISQRPGFDPKLLLHPDLQEINFEHARLLDMNIDFVRKRKENEKNKKNSKSTKSRIPLQKISQHSVSDKFVSSPFFQDDNELQFQPKQNSGDLNKLREEGFAQKSKSKFYQPKLDDNPPPKSSFHQMNQRKNQIDDNLDFQPNQNGFEDDIIELPSKSSFQNHIKNLTNLNQKNGKSIQNPLFIKEINMVKRYLQK